MLLLLLEVVVPALSGTESGANDGKPELGADVGMAERGALLGSRLVMISDANETGCIGGIFKDKVEAGKLVEVKLEALVLLGTNEEW